MEIIPTKKQST